MCCRWGTARNGTTRTPTSSTTGSGSASASRCCAPRASDSGETITDSRQVNPGEVWEENEFWIELSWRIDPDGSLGIRRYHESRARPGSKLTVDEYYGWMFSNSVPGLPERAAAEGLTPLQWMRRYGAFEICAGQGAQHEQPVPAEELADARVSPAGRVYTGAPEPFSPNIVPTSAPETGRRGPPRRGDRRSTGRCAAASPPRPGGWSSTPRRSRTGAGRSTRCPATSRATSTRPPGPRPAGAAVHLPAADPDPYPVGQFQVAGRARPHQPGLDPPA